ncbi:pyridoxamine 5'-phosphate oxidase [Candidatus Poribacteria bacterium]|nr:pyridoxamine 5'-phosphate oxidase [Candidatus Poribacteria bacterium]MYB65069.1 pyridoxamine 5'-phosphate oxidase [Candidatus Poribacteria bacterium]MYF56273.1 pyridoxamine 5'-phosphate oxidase [Candidatus Poribacteria bacterium]MYI93777.1 pyridoxamine 5'-phosphate oxidase [Candidatus Poribacteria bacterium]
MNTDNLRREYQQHGGLTETDATDNPFDQFEKWFSDAIEAKIDLPDAMTLATATADGIPSARMVVLRGFDKKGFCFYTDYDSQKGSELAANPHAAAVFYWRELDRQVRISGTIVKMTDTESDAYFESRPRDSQLAVWTERQTVVISGREHLEQNFEKAKLTYADKHIPRPTHWGGYRLMPTMFEFWQGSPSRLHDRIRYTLMEDGNWTIETLSP